MSIFILMLAFPNHEIQTTVKCAVLISSLIMGIVGFTMLRKERAIA
jgi:Na+/H+ antiporter NhaA